jgi:hypothetical protein
MDHDEVDHHGVPRCRHCGGNGDLSAAGVGFTITADDQPALRFRCMLGLTADCGGVQQISCRIHPRLLVPLSRLSPQYHAMSIAGKHLGRVWGHWRRRYGVAGQEPDTRTYRRESVPCQRLRAQTARLIEWFRILLRLGWLAGRTSRRQTHIKTIAGTRRLNNVLRARERHRLNVPFGRYAFRRASPPTRNRRRRAMAHRPTTATSSRSPPSRQPSRTTDRPPAENLRWAASSFSGQRGRPTTTKGGRRPPLSTFDTHSGCH